MIVKMFNMKKDFHLPGEEMLSNATIPSTISSTYLLEHIRMLIVMMIISLIMLTTPPLRISEPKARKVIARCSQEAKAGSLCC